MNDWILLGEKIKWERKLIDPRLYTYIYVQVSVKKRIAIVGRANQLNIKVTNPLAKSRTAEAQ